MDFIAFEIIRSMWAHWYILIPLGIVAVSAVAYAQKSRA